MKCPSDNTQTISFVSSYDSPATNDVWNFKGYDDNGFESSAYVPTYFANPTFAYNQVTNPVRYSLSNRFAPTSTIITHCIYHRGTGYQKDIILRLDGTAKLTDVSGFGATPNQWRVQN